MYHALAALVAVFDAVAAGLADRKDRVLAVVLADAAQGQPAAEPAAETRERGRLGGDLDVEPLRHGDELDHEQCDVVLGRGRAAGVLEHLLRELVRTQRGARGERARDAIDADVDALGSTLDQPVRVGDERRADAQHHLHVADAVRWGEPEREARRRARAPRRHLSPDPA